MPPGTHAIDISWEYPQRTKQMLASKYTVTVDNPFYGKTEDKQIAEAIQKHGKEKVVVFQNGRDLNGAKYEGMADVMIGKGGFANLFQTRIYPDRRTIEVGPGPKGKYCRALLRFDLSSLKGKKVKEASLKMTFRPGERYVSKTVAHPIPIHPMLKSWKEGKGKTIGVMEGKKYKNSKGYPSGTYQALPEKWEKFIASGESDRGPKVADLVADAESAPPPGAKADITGLVQDWVSGKVANHGMIIGHDYPEGAKSNGEGKRKRGVYKQHAFFSSEEPYDIDFRPRLIVILE